jgi:signal transduction histidine kinase
MESLPRPRGKLFRKYLALIMALVGGTLLASSGLHLYRSYQENKTSLLRLQREKALGAASKIEDFVKGIELQINRAAPSPWLGGEADLKDQIFDLRRLFRQVPAVTEIAYLDAAGKEQLRVSRLAMNVIGSQADLSREPSFLEAKAGRTYFSPVHFRKESEPYMTIATSGSGSATGVMVAEVNLKFIWDVISQIRIGKAGHAYVVDGNGRLIAHPDITLVLKQTDLSALSQVQAALAARSDQEGAGAVMVARDPRGARVLTAFAAVAPLRWSVFVEQPLQEAFEPLYATLLQSALLVLVSLLLSVAGCLILARKMVKPVRALQAGAARIGAGALDHRITIQTGDELEALAQDFNSMAAQLQESYTGLEQKVDARTRELRGALEQLQALGEVSQAVNSSLDLPTVLTSIVSHAVQLSGADGGAIYEFDEATQKFLVRATYQMEDEMIAALRANPIGLGEGAVGQAAVVREPVQISDILEGSPYTDRMRDVAARVGLRAVLAVPLLREDRIAGGLVVRRRSPGEFAPETVALLGTFAAQSAVAIQNARLFRELEEKRNQLETAGRHKSEFLASMSHELRTPLNAIIGFSEVLAERMFGELGPKQAQYVQVILSSGRHLLALINDILDLSKVEAGRLELVLTTFELHGALESALALVRERATRHGLMLELTMDSHLTDVVADERKVKQILLNLLSNAVKFTPEGGRVQVNAAAVDGMAEISVADTGIGIAPEDQEVIFEEFRQVGSDYARNPEGTGLGLALARKLVELHGGRIWVKSQVGQGSTFTFTIPVNP